MNLCLISLFINPSFRWLNSVPYLEVKVHKLYKEYLWLNCVQTEQGAVGNNP